MTTDLAPQEQPQPAANGTQDREKAALATVPAAADTMSPFSSQAAYQAAWGMAKALAMSSLVPQVYRDNPANCLIAMELASRLGVSVMAAMQNLDVIQGKPSWSAKFLIATVNASGRFSPLRFEWGGKPGESSWACRAVAKDKQGGERCEGPWVTWEMATKEGWTTKNGSKWKTMPELMFCYRAAAFWSRVYCPEISIGFQTSEEVEDVHGIDATPREALPTQLTPGGAASLEAVLGVQRNATQVVEAEPEPATESKPELKLEEPQQAKKGKETK